MTRFFVLVAAVCLTLSTSMPAVAQTSGTASAAPILQTALPSGHPLTIIVNNVGQHGATSVLAINEPVLRVRGWTVAYAGPAKPISMQRLQSVTKLASSAVTYSNYTLTLSGGATADTTVATQLEIPVGTQVTLYVNGKLEKSGILNNSVTFRDGGPIGSSIGHDARASVLHTIDGDVEIAAGIVVTCCSVVGNCIVSTAVATDGEGNTCTATASICISETPSGVQLTYTVELSGDCGDT